MTLELREEVGDLLTADVEAIAHGCNCKGVMGAGIAKPIRNRYPDMYDLYQDECVHGRFIPGDCLPWITSSSPTVIGKESEPIKIVFNLATQKDPGSDARLKWLAFALSDMICIAEDRGIKTIGLPRIGCGIGGLKWNDVKSLLEKFQRTTQVQLIVYTLPEG